MLTWNDILDIEPRNRDNPDVARLIAAIRNGDFDDVFRVAVTQIVEDITPSEFQHVNGAYLDEMVQWRKLVALCNLEK
jgi:hypothetical protein